VAKPSFTPDQGGAATLDDSQIVALNLKTGKTKPLYRGGYNAHYVPSGHLLFLRQGSIYAVRFRSYAPGNQRSPVR